VKLGPPRLLPIVIAAAAALLLFKGIGLVTEGGYTLVGTAAATAEEHAATSTEGGDAPGAATELPTGPNMADESPTIEDKSVTMELPSGPGGGANGGHGATTPAIGPAEAGLPTEACPPSAEAAPAEGTAPEAPSDLPCLPDPGVNEHGDALPLVKDNTSGQMVPLADVTDKSSEGAIEDRLSQRRDELDQREKELEMRSALLEAAEKRLDERTAELKALEQKVNKLVDENKTAEQQQFVGLVAMYENMKPKDAATIFNQLDMPVLLGVTRAMNPRKLAPVMARMDPMKAKALTDGLAAADQPAPPVTEAAVEDLTNLPQIVGQ
jgi:flagellar motility protein MotE (MotC chaperone)